MAVKIRFSRIGKTHSPVYRIVAVDERAKRDGKFIENLGTYNPLNHTLEQWHAERIDYWVSQGAQKTDAVKRLESMLKKGKLNRPGMPKVVVKQKEVSYVSQAPKKVEEPTPAEEVAVEAKTKEAVEVKETAPAAAKEAAPKAAEKATEEVKAEATEEVKASDSAKATSDKEAKA